MWTILLISFVLFSAFALIVAHVLNGSRTLGFHVSGWNDIVEVLVFLAVVFVVSLFF